MPERVLRVDFEDAAAFETEYAANLVNGGIFVASDERFELRERVRVDLCLGFCHKRIRLEGEVVHQIPPEMAQTGATPGVAVQFDEPGAGCGDRRDWGATFSLARAVLAGWLLAPVVDTDCHVAAPTTTLRQAQDGGWVAPRNGHITQKCGFYLGVKWKYQAK